MLPVSNGFSGDLSPGLPDDSRDSSDALARAKADFLANISHEVRTPLTAILGFTELLEHALPPNAGPECRDHLRAVKRNGEILLGLVSDVLELSRIESGEAKVAIGPCDLFSLIRDLEVQKSIEADAKGLEFDLEIDETVPCPETF